MNAAGLSTGLAAYRDESPAVPFETLFQRRWTRWGLFIAFWTFLGLFNAGQSYIIRRIALDLPFNLVDAIVIGVVDWYLWAALVRLIFFLFSCYLLVHSSMP